MKNLKKAVSVIIYIITFIAPFISAKAQDITLPMQLEYLWPLHSAALDSAESSYSREVFRNKVRSCSEYNQDSSLASRIFYDRSGRVTNAVYYSGDTIIYEKIYTRNAMGQIITKTEIDYKFPIGKNGRYDYISTYEYSDNLPSKYLYDTPGGYTYSEEAVYNNGSLTDVIHFFNNDKQKQSRDAVTYEKTDAGNIIKIKKEGGRFFESAAMDSVVMGGPPFIAYKINNNRIVSKTVTGGEYKTEDNYTYKDNGLIDSRETIYTGQQLTDKSVRMNTYQYSYYED